MASVCSSREKVSTSSNTCELDFWDSLTGGSNPETGNAPSSRSIANSYPDDYGHRFS